MRIELIVFWCAVGLVVLIAISGLSYLLGLKKGIKFMTDFFKSAYMEKQNGDKDE